MLNNYVCMYIILVYFAGPGNNSGIAYSGNAVDNIHSIMKSWDPRFNLSFVDADCRGTYI